MDKTNNTYPIGISFIEEMDAVNQITDSSLPKFQDVEETEENMLYTIHTLFPRMPKTAKKISTYMLNNPQSFIMSSISQLSEKIGVSTSAITRYSQYMGYSGFAELKYHFEASLRSSFSESLLEEDSIHAVKVKISNNYKRAFENTIMHLDERALDKAATLILNSNKIYLFGHGGSNYIAQLAEMLFMQIGISCHAYGNPPLASTAAGFLGTGDVAIGLSSSGNAVLAVDALKKAKENGAKTIAITANGSSRLAQNSDVSLTYHVHTKDDLRYFHILKQAEFAVIGTLQLCVLQKNQMHMEASLENFKKSFFGKSYVY